MSQKHKFAALLHLQDVLRILPPDVDSGDEELPEASCEGCCNDSSAGDSDAGSDGAAGNATGDAVAATWRQVLSQL